NGVLEARYLPQIWRPPRHPVHLHDTLVTLLERFQVISRLQTPSGEEQKLLIPCMFPDQPPTDQANSVSTTLLYSLAGWHLGRIYRFAFVPLGLFSRVIVRALAASEYHPILYWKYGIVLQTKSDITIRLTIDYNDTINLGGETGKMGADSQSLSSSSSSLAT